MAFSTTQACPTCKELLTVYVDEGGHPAHGTSYTYSCPKCGVTNLFYVGAHTPNVAIPSDATVGVANTGGPAVGS